MYAIVRAGGRQEKVAVGDVIEIDRQSGDPGFEVVFPALLLVDGDAVTSDAKSLAEVSVTGEILSLTKGPKIDILKYENKPLPQADGSPFQADPRARHRHPRPGGPRHHDLSPTRRQS